MYKRSNSSDGSSAGCGCYIVLLVFNLCLGGWSVNYLLQTFLDKTIPFGWAMVVGLFGGEFTIPAAVVTALLKWLGVL